MFWGIAFCLSCSLSGQQVTSGPGPTTSATEAIMGESRVLLSRHYYQKADEYLHGGIPHQTDKAFDQGFYQDIMKKVAPKSHIHISPDKVTELMPWLSLAIQTDPGNLEIYLVSAFWLDHDANRPDIALQLLSKAQINIPFNFEVQLEKGRIHLKHRHMEEARIAFDAGLNFIKARPDDNNDDVRLYRSRLLLYRALIFEVDGDRQSAIRHLKQYLEIFPHDQNIIDRVKALKQGDKPSLLASKLWRDTLEKEDMSRKVCTHEDHVPTEKHEHDVNCGH